MKHELQLMRDRGHVAIVNCASIGGLVDLRQRAAYHGTKHALLGMTKSAAVLWLCSPAASFVIGVGLPVDGGFTAH